MKLVLVGVLAAISMGGIYLWSTSQTKTVPTDSSRALDIMTASSSRSGPDSVSDQVLKNTVGTLKSGESDDAGVTRINDEETSLTAGTCPDLRNVAALYEEYPVLAKKAFGIEKAREGVSDTDGDCLLDSFEIEQCYNGCDPNIAINTKGVNEFMTDYDGDGLTTGDEQRYGTSPMERDTDLDDLPDNEEITRGTNPLIQDSDGDSISDGTEIRFALNPKIADADTPGVYPATWTLADDLAVTFMVAGTAREVIAFKNSKGPYWDPHNHVFWRGYTLEAIDYAVVFDSPIMVEKVIIKNPIGKVFYPVYFLANESTEMVDFADLVMARSSTVDTVIAGENVHQIGSLIRSFALTDNLTQFKIEHEEELRTLY